MKNLLISSTTFIRNNLLFCLSILLVCLLFTFLRLYKIDQSLFFYGDMGRDFQELYDWKETYIPPLIGPQNSALPFNQSPLYFYALFPIYILSGGSLFSSIYTNLIFHLIVFIFGLYYLQDNRKLQFSLIIVFFLISIHPQYIMQHRYVWNPSFVGICMALAFYSFLKMRYDFSKYNIAVFTGSLAAANSFSYSAAPALFIMLFITVLVFKKKIAQIGIALILFLILYNIPLLIFDLRYNFLLTKQLLYADRLQQIAITASNQLVRIRSFLLVNGQQISLLLPLALVVNLFKNTVAKQKDMPFIYACIFFLLTFLVGLYTTIEMQPHYIFPMLVFFFISISLLPRILRFLSLLLCVYLWLQPGTVNGYLIPAPRSARVTQQCVIESCKQLDMPLFLSVQSAYHGYHSAYEFKYLYKEAGCKVFNVDIQPDKAKHMIVVADGAPYQHGKTAYNELTLFGDSKEVEVTQCGNMSFHLIEKNK